MAVKRSKVTKSIIFIICVVIVLGASYASGVAFKNENESARPAKKTTAKVTDESNYEKLSQIIKNYKAAIPEEDEEIAYGNVKIKSAKAITNDVKAAAPEGNESENYIGTNLQKQNVDEDDIAKTDGRCIASFDFNESVIKIYKPDGKDTKLVSTIIPMSHYKGFNADYYYNPMLFLYDSKLIFINTLNEKSGYNMNRYENATQISIYDLSDLKKPVLVNYAMQKASVFSARIAGGVLYTVNNYDIYPYYVKDVTKYSDYVTYFCEKDNRRFTKSQNLILPESSTIPDYPSSIKMTYISAFDLNTYKLISDKTIVGTIADNVYMDTEYLIAGSYDVFTNKKSGKQNNSSTLYAFSLKSGNIESRGTLNIPGKVLNQFCFDIHNGYLRTVTTVQKYNVEYIEKYRFFRILSEMEKTTNSLYTIDMKDFTVKGKIEGLAKDERIYSARFDGEIGYFVTYRETDPLFSVDLSNPANPKILSALKIDGFSSYLHPFGPERLLGIGYNTEDSVATTVKITMFDTSDKRDVKDIVTKTVTEKDVYCEATDNHKAVFADNENMIFGFGYDDYEDNDLTYVLYKYQNEKFKKLKNIVFDNNDITADNYARGFSVGDYFYIVHNGKLAALDTHNDYKMILDK